jgi:hypothetical protein
VVCSGLLWFTVVYCGLLWFTVVYCGLLWFTLVYSGLLWFTLVYSGLLWFTVVYRDLPWFVTGLPRFATGLPQVCHRFAKVYHRFTVPQVYWFMFKRLKILTLNKMSMYIFFFAISLAFIMKKCYIFKIRKLTTNFLSYLLSWFDKVSMGLYQIVHASASELRYFFAYDLHSTYFFPLLHRQLFLMPSPCCFFLHL